MGYINKILPKKIKPFSRYLGYYINSIIYKIRCIGKQPYPSPIFILGNQKSGTSVIAGLLGEVSGKRTSIDLFYSGFKFSLFLKWKNKKISTDEFINENKLDFSSEIIKEPHFSVFYKELKEKFPESIFIMILRNPFENIRSILDRLGVEGTKRSLKKEDKKKFFHSWSLLLNNNWIGGAKNQYIEALAERWNLITNSYIENENNIILIKYEDFLCNKKEVIHNLSKKLNLKITSDISHLLNKQFQPKGKEKNRNVKYFFGTQNYNRIKHICKENMNKLGY